jgi:protein TonB
MAEQSRDAVERLQRGLIIALIAIVAILALVLVVRMLRGGTELVDPISTQSGPVVDGQADTVGALLAGARSAMADSRLVSPAGNNAYENYLAVLDQQPDNVSAREALNDLYGIAVSSADQAMAAGDIDDAERLAELLARSNPNSFTVVNLRQRIERARATAAAAEAAEAQRLQAQQAAGAPATPAEPEPAPAEPAPEPASDLASLTSPSAPSPGTTTQAAAPASPPPAARPPATTTTTTTAAAAPQPAVPAVREARILARVDPQYPREAMRGRQQGWVEVEFTIGRDGSVSDAVVVASRPSRIFDRAATRAIQEWRFEPRQENGQPVPSRLRQRFDFRLD